MKSSKESGKYENEEPKDNFVSDWAENIPPM